MIEYDHMQGYHENQFQDLEWARPRIQAYIRSNARQKKGYSLSGLFTMLRKQTHLSLVGDYSLLWIIVDETGTATPNRLRTALHKSSEYRSIPKREKMWWMESLKDLRRSSRKKTTEAIISRKKPGMTKDV